jgi:hypothetical protein
MYAFALFLMVGAPLMLGSLWGLAWLGLFVPPLAARALGEEAMLTVGLEGYADYARRVRFRKVPGIWCGDPACDGGDSPLTGLTFSAWITCSMANSGQGPPRRRDIAAGQIITLLRLAQSSRQGAKAGGHSWSTSFGSCPDTDLHGSRGGEPWPLRRGQLSQASKPGKHGFAAGGRGSKVV